MNVEGWTKNEGVWAKDGGVWAKNDKVGKECILCKGVISLGNFFLSFPTTPLSPLLFCWQQKVCY